MNRKQRTNLHPDDASRQPNAIFREESNSQFDKMFREQIIAGTVYPEVQKQLIAKDKKMTLEKAIETVKNHEASIKNMKE